MTPVLVLLLLGALLSSAGLSALARRYALARHLLDVPNERSSHSVPMPRGGGIAIAAVVLAGLGVLVALGVTPPTYAMALGGGGAIITVAGWLDDRRGLGTAARLLAHTVAAGWAVALLHGMPWLSVGVERVHLGTGGSLLAVLAIVWATNLYNFMDGIDGLAAGEAVVVGTAAGLLLAPGAWGLAPIAFLVAAGAGGFLVWNWPPARLFMGDVGSGFLGFVFGTLALASENARALPALLWLVLLGPFFLDATVTLLRRIARGERWLSAHRSHAYQRAVQSGWSHRRVTLAVTMASVLMSWLAVVGVRSPELLGPVLAGAGLALGALYLVVERRCPMIASHPAGESRERPPGESSADGAARSPRPATPERTEKENDRRPAHP